MDALELKYGCNPNQKPARIYVENGKLPVRVLNGRPGYINFLDALNGWQLVRELKQATGLPGAASFKHVSPAGAAVGVPLNDMLRKVYFVPDGLELTPQAVAYVRARGADRLSSYGDFIALSDTCDEATAALIQGEVSDGVIAPGYTEEALAILKNKRKGSYTVLQMDETYHPAPMERKEVFGITFEQNRNEGVVDTSLFQTIVTKEKNLPPEVLRDLMVALIALKYTQSNSVCYAVDGQTIGVGAGQQSRIHCTRLAGDKADKWQLRQHPRVLALPFRPDLSRPVRDNTVDIYLSEEWEDVLGDSVWQEYFTVRPEPLTRVEKRAFLEQIKGVSLGSDAFFPFGDNIQRAARSGVSYVAQPGGSIRDDQVIETCNHYGMAMAFTGLRLFHH
jgi:phosphoribosylaminoimidazolecarboxamide formyltransferase/IMP cyclohydrolase